MDLIHRSGLRDRPPRIRRHLREGKMAFREARLWGAIGLFSLLVACGGGGSSGSDGTNAGGSDPANSIVPAAPPLGEILTADASSLRPLISGATWTYAGIHTLDGNSTRYTNAVTQTAQGGTFTETSSNALNEGTDSVTLSLSNGSIINSSVGALLSGLTQQITYPELRSPVRQNDQITLMDQQVTDIGEDLDGDGKNDYWVIDNIQQFPNCVVEIYNRWGEMLFRSTGYNTPWDGKYKGIQCQTGAYSWKIKYTDYLNVTKDAHGHVILLW